MPPAVSVYNVEYDELLTFATEAFLNVFAYFYPKAIVMQLHHLLGQNSFRRVIEPSATVFSVFCCDNCITCMLFVPEGGADVNVKVAP